MFSASAQPRGKRYPPGWVGAGGRNLGPLRPPTGWRLKLKTLPWVFGRTRFVQKMNRCDSRVNTIREQFRHTYAGQSSVRGKYFALESLCALFVKKKKINKPSVDGEKNKILVSSCEARGNWKRACAISVDPNIFSKPWTLFTATQDPAILPLSYLHRRVPRRLWNGLHESSQFVFITENHLLNAKSSLTNSENLTFRLPVLEQHSLADRSRTRLTRFVLTGFFFHLDVYVHTDLRRTYVLSSNLAVLRRNFIEVRALHVTADSALCCEREVNVRRRVSLARKTVVLRG
jgi:hypothetical protein